MKCLLVIAHPMKNSLCQSLAAVAREALAARGHEIDVTDLYADGFLPAMTPAELQAHNSAPDTDGEDSRRLMAAEVLVLAFPTWWFGFPAILKGWFDRVWLPGVAFEVAPGTSSLRPRLMRLRHVVAVTTLGAPRWVDWLVLRQPVKHILKRAIAGVCAPQARLHYLALHEANAVTPERFEAFAARIRRTLSTL